VQHYTEKELLRNFEVDLNYCELLEKQGIVTFDEIGDLIPGYVHLNSNKTGGLTYLNKKALEIFERDIEEIRALGPAFLIEISDKKSQQIFTKKKQFFSDKNNLRDSFSHLQRLHYPRKKIPYTLFYTTSKVYTEDTILSFSQPMDVLKGVSFITAFIDSAYEFYNKNFYKYKSLTNREWEILKYIVEGFNNKQIAESLCISYHTVRTHRKNICAKLETSRPTDFDKFVQAYYV